MHTSCIPPKQTAIHPTATAPVLPGSLPQLLVAVLAAVLAPPAGSHGARSCPHGAHPVHPVSVGTAPPRRSFMHGHAGGHAIHHLLLSVDLMELVKHLVLLRVGAARDAARPSRPRSTHARACQACWTQ